MILWNDMLKDAFVWLISNPWLFFSIGAVLLFMEHWKFIGFVVALGYILMKCLPVVMKCLPVVMKSVFSWMQRILFKFWVLCFDNQRNVKTKTEAKIEAKTDSKTGAKDRTTVFGFLVLGSIGVVFALGQYNYMSFAAACYMVLGSLALGAGVFFWMHNFAKAEAEEKERRRRLDEEKRKKEAEIKANALVEEKRIKRIQAEKKAQALVEEKRKKRLQAEKKAQALAAEEKKLKLQLEQVRQRVVENVADIQAMGATS